ncbi:helix-turn-helix domain-containing protein [Streptomyces sp. NBC_01420]|uniref:helix-turn-helix domain-containing protein n=1 Tax=Streptomyces sp. NBC_01420 TaxID=2903858 RepID=UPI003251C1C9
MDTHNQTPEGGARPMAERFGALIRQLAGEAGYDMTPGAGGQLALSRATGMSTSAVGRMINGITLPRPDQFEKIARALGTDVRNLLVAAEVISSEAWPEGSIPDVRSSTSQASLSGLTPEAAADAWRITSPVIRSMLLNNIEQAIRLQREQDHGEHKAATSGAP